MSLKFLQMWLLEMVKLTKDCTCSIAVKFFVVRSHREKVPL